MPRPGYYRGATDRDYRRDLSVSFPLEPNQEGKTWGGRERMSCSRSYHFKHKLAVLAVELGGARARFVRNTASTIVKLEEHGAAQC